MFNIFFQEARPIFKKAKEKGITIITKVPLDSGWLTGKYDENSEFEGIRSRWDIETIERRAKLVQEIKNITGDDLVTKYAMAFIMSFDEIDLVIPGIKNEEHLKSHIEYHSYQLPEKFKQAFIDLYDKHIKNDPLPW